MLGGLTLALLVTTPLARAIMSGAAPDSPAARIDVNHVDSPWTSAVAVLVNGGTYSGVVVAPRHVLTAAHVIGGASPSVVSVQVNAQATPTVLGVASIARLPSASFPYDDLALLTLATAVPESVQVLPIHRGPLPPAQVLTLVGYGYSGSGDGGPWVPGIQSVKRRGSNVADAVQTTVDASGRTSLFYLFDFDGPNGVGALGGPTLGNADEAGLAGGDSGSPAYATIGGTRWLIGINNLVAPAPGSTTVDYRFGTLGGGLLLSDPRFIDWLTEGTQGTLGQSNAPAGEVPLPAWALASLGGALLLASSQRPRPRAR